MSDQTILSPSRKMLMRSGATLLGIAVTVVGVGVASRIVHEHSVKAWTDQQAMPTVALARMDGGSNGGQLALPGHVQPYTRAVIYARVSGYLKQWNADIGAHVKAGQVLATIDTPDLDQQYAQAKASLASAEANANLAEVTAKRWSTLLKEQAVSQQMVDEKVSDATAQEAIAAAARATVGQLAAMEGFKTITAPFDGVVTARKVDVGSLITVGNGQGQELFEVSNLQRLRIYVQVPQSFSAELRAGMKAQFRVPQFPGREFDATVATTSNALEPTSASMLVELDADNPNDVLPADAYADVSFDLPGKASVVRLPATALVAADRGLEVALVTRDNKIAFQRIELGRDFGDKVEVLSGLSPKDRVIDNPPETLQAGETVHVGAASVPDSEIAEK